MCALPSLQLPGCIRTLAAGSPLALQDETAQALIHTCELLRIIHARRLACLRTD